MVKETCELCGFTPKDRRNLYFSAYTMQTRCDNHVACERRRLRKTVRTDAKPVTARTLDS